ncbi:MAG TPA: VWA domain-containing protein [Bryobacteraceae bacterium]|jgi:VWFA-related protein|nr:VWA domain-containing protein [Bryobacteraceae bacterium]
MKTAGVSALVLALCAVAHAQAPSQPAPQAAPAQGAEDSDAIFTSDTRLVEVHATVTEANGRLLTTLPRSAFAIYENDVQQEIKVFKREDAPVSLGLVIDNSASMLPRRAQVAAAALKLVRASNKDDEVFIMTFNDKPALVQDFTHDVGQLEKSLNRIDSEGATAMRDAVSLAVEHLKRLAKNDKKVVLVVTDGEDNSSVEETARVVREARQDDILVYAIGLLTSETAHSAAVAKHDLDALTMETGGEAFYPKALSEVDDIAEHVAQDLRNQYTIAYNPTNQAQDGTFRRIKVTVNFPGAVVKTRTGYYAEPAGGVNSGSRSD